MIDSFDKSFGEQLRRANLMFDTAGAESWQVGAAIFGAGAAFAGTMIALIKAFGL